MAKKVDDKEIKNVAMDFSDDAGKGFENLRQDDLSIPFLTIIQAMSPELNKQKPEYIQGARAGMIIDSVSNKILGSDESPLQFIPCAYRKSFVEWRARESGGGMVKIHDNDTILNECTRNDKNQDVLKNGNVIVTTGYMIGLYLVDDDYTRCMISFTSTQLKKVRQWLSIMTAMKMNGKNGKYTPPMYSHIYDISTVPESNNKGTWYGWKIVLNRQLDQQALLAPARDMQATNTRLALPAPKDVEAETDTNMPF